MKLLTDLDAEIKKSMLVQNDLSSKKAMLAEKQKNNALKEEIEIQFKQSLNSFDRIIYKLYKFLAKKQNNNKLLKNKDMEEENQIQGIKKGKSYNENHVYKSND